MAEQMKPSGIDWIGDIPESWDVEPIKYRVSFYNGDRSENYPSKNEMQSEGIPFINAGHIEGNCLNMNDMDYISEEKYRVMGGVKLQQGDILYCLRGSVGKNVIVNIDKGTVASSLVAIRSNRIINKYLYYCLNSNVEEVQRCLWDNGTAQPNLSADSLGKFKICIPPDHEQQAIADFLDKECAQIDSIAADLEKQITLLQQYKKSLITETVTKGLDKSVPMKDSGVEWLGKIPAYWDLEPIKYRVTFHNGDRGENYPSKSELQSEGIPFINAGHLEGDGLNMDNMDYISEEKYRIMGGVKLRSGDILYCLRGSVGKNAIVDMNQGTVASSLVAIRSVRISAEYLYYCLNSCIEEVQRYLWDNGTAQPNLSADNLGKYKICIPTVEEQRTIVKYLNNICSQIDNLIIGKRKQISTIHQHKKSLIYEYVTGKKRVKEVQ